MAVGLGLLGGGGSATAKEKVELTWQFSEVYSTAIRYLRVDLGCKITDKDETAAYLLFECAPDQTGKPPKHGGLELFHVEVNGAEMVRAQVNLTDDPSYVEKRFLDLLERKLRQERGPAPQPHMIPPPKLPATPDGGASS